jgi:hypothetical protein
MIDIKKISKRKRGRPQGSRSTFIGPNVGLRLYPELDAKLDAWIAQQGEPNLSRPEAIRRLLNEALTAAAKRTKRKGGS